MNERGFTLVELMATILIIGVVMAITIPNVTGIFNQGKLTTYGEDAKKLRNTAEYLYRGDSSIDRLVDDGDCIVFSFKYLDNDEYKPPYGGYYLETKSFVVVKKENKRLRYFVQLLEFLPEGGVRGYKLTDILNLDGSGYMDKIGEFNDANSFADVDLYKDAANRNNLKTSGNFTSVGIGCSNINRVYTP